MQEASATTAVLGTNQTPPKVFVPGAVLQAEIDRQRMRGERAGGDILWLAPGLHLPRLIVREAHRELAVREQSALFLRTGDRGAREAALREPSVRAELKQLLAAALRDLAGCSVDHVQTTLGYASARGAQVAARGGRAKLARLGAWPWWPAAHANRLHDVAGAMAGDPFLADCFEAWVEWPQGFDLGALSGPHRRADVREALRQALEQSG